MVLNVTLTHLSRVAAARDVLEMSRILGAIKRHKLLILFIVAATTTLSYYYLKQVPDLCRAHAQIVIEGDKRRITRIEDVTERISPGTMTNNTQSAILQSRLMAEKVIARMHLKTLPARPAKTLLGKEIKPTPPSHDVLVTQFLNGLSIQPSDQSYVVRLEYISPDPRFAAAALNVLISVYLEDQMREKNSISHNATRWLAQRVEEMRNKVVDSENRLEQVRRSSDSIFIEGKSLNETQLGQLSQDLLAAQKERGEIETRIQKFDRAMKHPEDAETNQFIMESPFMQTVAEEEQALDARIADMRTRYRDEHPYMRSLLAQQDELQEKKYDEMQRVRMVLTNDRDLANMRIQNITHKIDDLRLPLEDENETQISIRGLESEIEANKQLFSVLLARYKETDVQDEVTPAPDARVISRAFPPSHPFEPKRSPVIISTFILSLLTAIGLSMVLEFSAAGYQNSEQIELESDLPVIATIPEFTTSLKEVNHLQMLDTARFPLYAEAIRNLRTSLFDHAAVGTPPKVLLLSSSLPEEGKSSTALSLAVILQKAGKEVLLIDADMRRSQLAKSLKIGNVAGLGDYLSGKVAAQDVIYKDAHSGIFFIPAGTPEGHPLDLLERPEMELLMHAVRSKFDAVIIDAPPVMSVRDAALLAAHADSCLYMVRWEHTPRGAVSQGLKILREKFPGKNLSLALSRIHLKKQRYYKSSKDDYFYFTNYAFTPTTKPKKTT